MAAEWWDPAGKFAPLHQIQSGAACASSASRPPRGISAATAQSLKPFEGLDLLDIGCGGGLLSEPMARLGFSVTGADASERNIGIARAHAAQSGAAVDYRCSHRRSLAETGEASTSCSTWKWSSMWPT